MKIVSIDLSLRSTGLVYSDGNEVRYKLITPDKKIYNDEFLLQHNAAMIYQFINDVCPEPEIIAIEDLSLNSLSSSKDILYGNFWYLRCRLKEWFPKSKLEIVPILSWRSSLFNKTERKELTDRKKALKILEAEMKDLPRDEKKKLSIIHEEVILRSNIKYLTWEKLPSPYKEEFRELGFSNGCFDITDSFMINQYVRGKI